MRAQEPSPWSAEADDEELKAADKAGQVSRKKAAGEIRKKKKKAKAEERKAQPAPLPRAARMRAM